MTDEQVFSDATAVAADEVMIEVIGVDIDPEMVARASARYRLPNLRFVVGDVGAAGEDAPRSSTLVHPGPIAGRLGSRRLRRLRGASTDPRGPGHAPGLRRRPGVRRLPGLLTDRPGAFRDRAGAVTG